MLHVDVCWCKNKQTNGSISFPSNSLILSRVAIFIQLGQVKFYFDLAIIYIYSKKFSIFPIDR